MKVYKPSSQTVFLSRQSLFFTTSSMPNEHVFSSRGPALRAASAGPSAVGPDGPWDLRDSSPDTTGVRPVAPVEEEDATSSRWQDKAVLTDGPPASSQPAPDTIGVRSAVSDTGSARSQNDSFVKERLVRGVVWMRPGVKAAMEFLADTTGLSFSATCAEGLEVYARAKIQDQQEELFEPKMRMMMRREIRTSDDRHVPFEIKNAIAAEKTRILFTDLYTRMLLKEGAPLKEIHAKRDKAYYMAERNVLNTRTPKFKTTIAKYWQATDDQDWQAGQPTGRTDSTGATEADKPDA